MAELKIRFYTCQRCGETFAHTADRAPLPQRCNPCKLLHRTELYAKNRRKKGIPKRKFKPPVPGSDSYKRRRKGLLRVYRKHGLTWKGDGHD